MERWIPGRTTCGRLNWRDVLTLSGGGAVPFCIRVLLVIFGVGVVRLGVSEAEGQRGTRGLEVGGGKDSAQGFGGVFFYH